MTSSKITLPLLIAGALAAAAGGVAFASSGSGENDAAADLAKSRISLPQAITVAEQHVRGRAAGAELESEDGMTVYEVEVVAADRTVHEVKVDALSGKVIASALDAPDDESNDQDEEDDRKDA